MSVFEMFNSPEQEACNFIHTTTLNYMAYPAVGADNYVDIHDMSGFYLDTIHVDDVQRWLDLVTPTRRVA